MVPVFLPDTHDRKKPRNGIRALGDDEAILRRRQI
jgi:hypothetical protein